MLNIQVGAANLFKYNDLCMVCHRLCWCVLFKGFLTLMVMCGAMSIVRLKFPPCRCGLEIRLCFRADTA